VPKAFVPFAANRIFLTMGRWQRGIAVLRAAGLAGVLVLAVAAPAAATAAPAAAAPKGDNDRADLLDTISALATTSHDVIMKTTNSTITGSVDPGGKAATIVATSGDLEVDEIVDDGHVWLKMDLGKDTNSQLGITGDQWMELEPTKLTANNNLPIQPDASDPIDMTGIFAGLVNVKRDSDTSFSGTLDLTRVNGHNSPDPDEVAQAGAAATKTPFTVTTDDQGRITNLTVDTSGYDPGLGVTVDFTDYGAASPITDPASSVTAPDSVYTVFN
jgi:hypothetical protein